MKTGNKEFGNNLKKLREAKNYSQEELAEKIGVEYQTISRIETGVYFTNFENLQNIASALNVPLKDLFDYQNIKISKSELIKNITRIINKAETPQLEIINKFITLLDLLKK